MLQTLDLFPVLPATVHIHVAVQFTNHNQQNLYMTNKLLHPHIYPPQHTVSCDRLLGKETVALFNAVCDTTHMYSHSIAYRIACGGFFIFQFTVQLVYDNQTCQQCDPDSIPT